MILYAESSALLRWLLGSVDATEIAAILAKAEAIFTSRLTLVEVERAVSRHVRTGVLGEGQAAEARLLFGSALPHWRVVEITPAICERAGLAFPIEPVRALDAIHLATALFAARLAGEITLLSTDSRVVANADRLGLRAAGG